MARTTRMGFDGQAFYGVAGSTGTNLMRNSRGITITKDVDRGDTTVRGDSTVPPWHTESVAIRKLEVEIEMLNDSTDSIFVALMNAVDAGDSVAIRLKDYASGKGPDADFTVSASQPWPLEGEQVVTFTFTPSRDYGRAPQGYV